MTKKHGTERRGRKRKLLSSIISLILCVTMLLGNTFAWFTHTVTNEDNRIQMGELKVDLKMYKEDKGEYVSIADGKGDIFSEAAGNGVRWEPGKTEIVFLEVANIEDLALNYNIILNVTDLDTEDDVKPEEALEYAIFDGMKGEHYSADPFTSWDELIGKSIIEPQTGTVPSGKVLAAEMGALEAGESDYFALAVHMDEDAGNEYQGKKIKIDVQIVAKQMASEYDSFGNQYDADAEYGEDAWQPDVPVTYENVLPEGDFEIDGYWSLRTKTTGTSEILSGDAPSGSRYLHVGGDKDADASKRFVYLEAGVEYIVTGMVKQTGGAVPRIDLYHYYEDENNNNAEAEVKRHRSTFSLEEENEWQEVSYTFTVPENAEMTWVMIGKNATAGDVYWDNVQILKEKETTNEEFSIDAEKAKWEAKLAGEKAVSQMVEDDGWLPPLVEGENLVNNGSFDGSLDGWEPFNAAQTANATYVDTGYDEVGGSIKLVNRGMWRQYADVTEGYKYQVSFWYKVEEGFTTSKVRGPWIWIQWWGDGLLNDPSDPDNYKGAEGVGPAKSATIADGKWHFVCATIEAPEDAVIVEVIPRLLDTSEAVQIDNIQVYRVTGEPLELKTEGTFLYSDMDSTEISVELNMEHFSRYADGNVDFEVYNGNNLVWRQDDVAYSSDGIAAVNLSRFTFMKKDTPYCVKATVYDGDGEVIDVLTKEVYVYDRPEFLSKDGEYTKFGDDFYPIVGYHVFGDEDTKKGLAEAGINVVQLAYKTSADAVYEQLEWCKENGVKGLVCLYYAMKPAGDASNIAKTIDIVSDERIQNHEALFAYCIMDEAVLHMGEDAGIEALTNSYRLIRQYDNKNIITHMECYEEYFEKTSDYCDAYFIDPYYFAKDAKVYRNVSSAAEAVGEQKPLWVLTETYVLDNLNASGKPALVTGDDARNNLWQALIAGADAVGYFSISDCGNVVYTPSTTMPDGYTAIWETAMPEDSQAGAKLWISLCEFETKEKEIAYDHFVYKKSQTFNEKADLEAGYIYSSWKADGGLYMIVLNVAGEELEVNIPLTSADGSESIGAYTAEIIAGRDNASAITGNGSLNLTINGVEAILFKITTN